MFRLCFVFALCGCWVLLDLSVFADCLCYGFNGEWWTWLVSCAGLIVSDCCDVLLITVLVYDCLVLCWFGLIFIHVYYGVGWDCHFVGASRALLSLI